MSADNASASSIPADKIAAETERENRKTAADSLRRQIAKLKSGLRPRSLNEFIEEKMAEDKKAGGVKTQG